MLRWPTAVSISVLPRENLTEVIAPTLALVSVPVTDSVIPAAPWVMSRSAYATLPPDGVSSHDTRQGLPWTLVVVSAVASTVPPEFRRYIRRCPVVIRRTSNLATVPAELISARSQLTVPDAESPPAGTDSANRVTLLAGVPPAGTAAVISAALSCGIALEPLKSVQAARD